VWANLSYQTAPHAGKEKPMLRIASLVSILLIGVVVLAGCKAEGEIGDTSSNVVAPR
jgi:hypothetical protein